MNWRAFRYDAEDVSRAAGESLRMIYFRHWAVVACTQFENNVLLKPEVLQATRPLYCVVLDFRVDQKLASAWKIDEPPGVAILAPDGQLINSISGAITPTAFLDLVRRAQESHGAASRASSNPTTQRAPP